MSVYLSFISSHFNSYFRHEDDAGLRVLWAELRAVSVGHAQHLGVEGGEGGRGIGGMGFKGEGMGEVSSNRPSSDDWTKPTAGETTAEEGR